MQEDGCNWGGGGGGGTRGGGGGQIPIDVEMTNYGAMTGETKDQNCFSFFHL